MKYVFTASTYQISVVCHCKCQKKFDIYNLPSLKKERERNNFFNIYFIHYIYLYNFFLIDILMFYILIS